jgi:hypothetical protein
MPIRYRAEPAASSPRQISTDEPDPASGADIPAPHGVEQGAQYGEPAIVQGVLQEGGKDRVDVEVDVQQGNPHADHNTSRSIPGVEDRASLVLTTKSG